MLVLCMSANAFGSDWAQLEAGTFRFRDPLNQERRFIPLRLDARPHASALDLAAKRKLRNTLVYEHRLDLQRRRGD